MTPELARVLIEAERAEYPRVVDLARYLSLAVRIESELLRSMRLRVMSSVEAGVEADLYFSPLVETRDVNAITLIPAVRELFLRELAEHKDALELAREVIEAAHGEMDAVILLEELVAYHALRDDHQAYTAMQRQLGRVILELEKSDVDPGLLGWAADAHTRLPERARNSQAGRVLTGMLDDNLKRLGVTTTEADSARQSAAYILSPIALGFQATPGGLSLCYPHRNGWTLIETQGADPVAIEVSWPVTGGWESRTLELGGHEPLGRIPGVPLGLVRLRGINGDETRLRVEGPFEQLSPKLLGLYRGDDAEVPAFIDSELRDLSWALEWRPLRSRDEPMVFLSMPDGRGRMAELYDELKRLLQSTGLSVWSADEQIAGGDEWNREISRAVGECQAAVVVLSPETSLESQWLFHELSLLAFRQEKDPDFSLHLLLSGGFSPEGAESLLTGLELPGLLKERRWHRTPESVAKALYGEVSAMAGPEDDFTAAIVHFSDVESLSEYLDAVSSGSAKLVKPLDELIKSGRPILFYAGESYQGQTSQGFYKMSEEISEPLLNQAMLQASRLGIERQFEPAVQDGVDRHQLLRHTLLEAEREAVFDWLSRSGEAETTPNPPPDGIAPSWKISDDGKQGHRGTVRSIAVSTDGAIALTAGNSEPDRTVKQWDLVGHRLIRTYEAFAEGGGRTPMAISSDNRRAITGYGGELRIIDLESGEHSALTLSEVPQTALAFVDEERYLVGAENGMLLLVNRSGVERDLAGSREEVVRLAVHENLAFCLRSSSLELIDLDKGEPIQRIEVNPAQGGPHWQPIPLYVDQANQRVLFDTPLRAFDLQTGKVGLLTDLSQHVVEVAGSRWILYQGGSEFSVVEMPSGSESGEINIEPEQPSCLALSGDGRRLVIADFSHNLSIYEVGPTSVYDA